MEKMYTIFIRLGVTIGCLMLILFATIKYAPASSLDPLSTAMKATGAKMEESSINAWVKLPERHYSDEQLQALVGQVMEQLEIHAPNYEIVHQQRNNHRVIKAEYSKPDNHVVVMAQVVPNQANGSKTEAYLVINFESLTSENAAIIPLQEKISKIVKKNGDSPQISTCLIGWLDGKLMDGESQTMLKSAFTAIDGIIVDKLVQDHYVSAIGFSSAIADCLQVNGKRINLNIAIRYSQYENRTYVIIGSPIITREY
jgi:hypothetical protein